MSANVPLGVPEVLFDSEKISNDYALRQLTPKTIREDPMAQEALQTGQVKKEFLRGVSGLAFYMGHTAPTEESSPIAFERHFNPMLKRDSDYFGTVDKFLSCVEKNSSKPMTEDQQNAVCSKEFKNMRLAAFKNELLYHNINKRFYMGLIQWKRHEGPL